MAGQLSSGVLAVIISFSIIGAVSLFGTCIAIRVYNSPRQRHSAIAAATVRQQPIELVAAARGLDQSTIETYKKVELGESRRLPGTNGIICPICLSEYASKETIRLMPECDHCFHVECIDVWLKLHGSCPLCRNSRKWKKESWTCSLETDWRMSRTTAWLFVLYSVGNIHNTFRCWITGACVNK